MCWALPQSAQRPHEPNRSFPEEQEILPTDRRASSRPRVCVSACVVCMCVRACVYMYTCLRGMCVCIRVYTCVLCVSVYVHMYVWGRVHVSVCLRACVHMCVCAGMSMWVACICVWYVFVSLCVCMSICVLCMYVCLCMCAHVTVLPVCVCIYVYMHVWGTCVSPNACFCWSPYVDNVFLYHPHVWP